MGSDTLTAAEAGKLLENATPGPWGIQGDHNDYEIRGPGPSVNGWNTGPHVMDLDARRGKPSNADADLIAAAPTLARTVIQLEAERDAARTSLHNLTGIIRSCAPCETCGGMGEVGDRYMVMGMHGEAEEVDERCPCQRCGGLGTDVLVVAAERDRLRDIAELAKAQLRTVPQVASPERTALIEALKAWDAVAAKGVSDAR